MSFQDRPDLGRAADHFLGEHGAGLEQQLDDGGIVSGARMPAVLGAVNRPAQGRAAEVIVSQLKRRAIRQDIASHTDTKTMGPITAAEWLAVLDKWRAEHPAKIGK